MRNIKSRSKRYLHTHNPSRRHRSPKELDAFGKNLEDLSSTQETGNSSYSSREVSSNHVSSKLRRNRLPSTPKKSAD